MNGISNLLNPIIHENPEHKLIINAYPVCDRSYSVCFWISYLYQCFGFAIGNIIHVACDCLIYNLIDRTCAHLRILGYRLQKLPAIMKEGKHQELDISVYEKMYLSECIKDHQSIFA